MIQRVRSKRSAGKMQTHILSGNVSEILNFQEIEK